MRHPDCFGGSSNDDRGGFDIRSHPIGENGVDGMKRRWEQRGMGEDGMYFYYNSETKAGVFSKRDKLSDEQLDAITRS